METALTEFHLAFNHFPVFSLAIALMCWVFGYFSRKDNFTRLALFLQVLSGLSAIAIYFTGKEAQGNILELYGPENFSTELLREYAEFIGKHETPGEIAAVGCWINGAIAFVVLLITWKTEELSRNLKFMLLPIISMLVAIGLVANAGYRGGHISHPEIRPDEQKIITNEMREYSWEDVPKSE